MLWWTLKQLKSANSEKRQQAAQKLGESKDTRAVEPLVAALRDEDYIVRNEAAIALGKIGDARAIEPLRTMLKSRVPILRKAAAEALKHLGWQPLNEMQRALLAVADRQWDEVVRLKAASVAPLLDVLKNKNPEVRRAAASSLGEIGDPRATDVLLVALKDKDSDVRAAAAGALKSLGWQPTKETQKIALAAAEGDWDAAKPLLDALKSEDAFERASAAEALGEIGDPRALAPLVVAAKDEDSKVRAAVVGALGEIGNPRALATLDAATNDKDPTVQGRAWVSLCDLGDDKAYTAMYQWLMFGDFHAEGMSVTGARMLGLMGDAKAVEPLLQKLKVYKDSQYSNLRAAIVEALGRLGNVKAVEPLLSALKDESSDVASAAAIALKRIDDLGAVDFMLAALKDERPDVRAVAAAVLGNTGDMGAVEPLLALFTEEKPNAQPAVVRAAAARALGKIGHERAAETLVVALKDTNSEVQAAAASALRNLGWEPANEEQRALLTTVERQIDEAASSKATYEKPLMAARKDKDSGARAAASVMGETGKPEAPAMMAALKDTDPQVRAEAARALGKIGNQEAIELLGSLLFNDTDTLVMQAVVGALGEIARTRGDSRAILLLGSAVHQEKREDLREAAAEALDKLSPNQHFDLKAAKQWFENWAGHGQPRDGAEPGVASGEILKDLKTLKEKFYELPEKYPRQADVVGFGNSKSKAMHAINTICGVCDDAARALSKGLDVNNLLIERGQIGRGLSQLVRDARQDTGVVALILAPEGVRLYSVYLNELEKIAGKIE